MLHAQAVAPTAPPVHGCNSAADAEALVEDTTREEMRSHLKSVYDMERLQENSGLASPKDVSACEIA